VSCACSRCWLPPHLSRDRPAAVYLPEHGEEPGDLHLPQARRRLSQPDGPTPPRDRPARGVGPWPPDRTLPVHAIRMMPTPGDWCRMSAGRAVGVAARFRRRRMGMGADLENRADFENADRGFVASLDPSTYRKAGRHGPTHPDRTGCLSPSRCRDARGGPPRGVRRRPRLGRPVPNRSRHLVGLAPPPRPRHLRLPDSGPPPTGVRPGGTESVEGGPGDFLLIPKGVVHREGNPGTEPNEAIVFRVGEGEILVNVDGP
jgi:hypothetical protein